MSTKIVIGAIAGAYGVRGEVRIKSFCAVPEEIETYSPLTDSEGNTYDLAIIRPIKSGYSARIAQVTSKEDADTLKGTELFAERDQLPNLPDDEFYHTDLIGLEVVDTGGETLGKIKAVHNHGADDLLEVTLKGSSKTELVPFTKAIVPTVDLEAGRVVIDPPEGLF